MSKWKLHIPTESNTFLEYKCGLRAGQLVRLRKDLVIEDHRGRTTGEVNLKGEVWEVLPGIMSDPVLWFPSGERHTWDDDAASRAEWFEDVASDSAPESGG